MDGWLAHVHMFTERTDASS